MPWRIAQGLVLRDVCNLRATLRNIRFIRASLRTTDLLGGRAHRTSEFLAREERAGLGGSMSEQGDADQDASREPTRTSFRARTSSGASQPIDRRDARKTDAVKLAARAILILLVVLGHNRIFHDHLYYTGYIIVYSFHVGSFFLLATFGKPRPLNRKTFAGMWRSFLWPYVIFTAIYGSLFFVSEFAKGKVDPLTWAARFMLALPLGTSPMLDAATGLKMLWFLPAFFVFCIFTIVTVLPIASSRSRLSQARAWHIWDCRPCLGPFSQWPPLARR